MSTTARSITITTRTLTATVVILAVAQMSAAYSTTRPAATGPARHGRTDHWGISLAPGPPVAHSGTAADLLVGGGAAPPSLVSQGPDAHPASTTTQPVVVPARPAITPASTGRPLVAASTTSRPATGVGPAERSEPSGWGCAAALAYIVAHAAPGFTYECAPHSAFGAYGKTCYHVGQTIEGSTCPGGGYVNIACPAPFVYENESYNTHLWYASTDTDGRFHRPIDPNGQGSPADQALCNRYM